VQNGITALEPFGGIEPYVDRGTDGAEHPVGRVEEQARE
jgi:hypothetical protein